MIRSSRGEFPGGVREIEELCLCKNIELCISSGVIRIGVVSFLAIHKVETHRLVERGCQKRELDCRRGMEPGKEPL